jgi:MerR family redox-sensitive transcriptional activator SoxR
MASNRGDELLSISEVAERCGIATSAVRYYESRGLVTSTRTRGNQRRFARESIRRISFITAAQAVGRSLEEITDALDSLPAGRNPTNADWSRLASSWRPRLDAQIAALTSLRDKLDECIGCGCLSLDRCAIYNTNDEVAVRGVGPRYLLGDEPSA